MRLVAVVLATTLFACGEDHAPADPDAGLPVDANGFAPGSCWPAIPHVAKGTATLGTGWEGFQTMPEVLPLEYGTQDGYMLVAHVRMTGFDPGDPNDIFNPRNPRTRIRAYFEDPYVPPTAHPAALTAQSLNVYGFCPFRAGYKDAGDGTYEMANGVPIVFDTCWRSDNLIGRRIRIELEIMDGGGGYAKDVKIVTAGAPLGYYPEEHDSPGCHFRAVPEPALQEP